MCKSSLSPFLCPHFFIISFSLAMISSNSIIIPLFSKNNDSYFLSFELKICLNVIY
jgi:hypothetical protein